MATYRLLRQLAQTPSRRFQDVGQGAEGLTHAKQLYSPEIWVERIAASWHELYDRRTVLLVQLPPTLERDDARLGWFLRRLPWWVPVAFEMRHLSWHVEEVFELLESSTVRRTAPRAGRTCLHPAVDRSFVYLRLHGPSHDWLYGGSHSDEELSWWAERIREWEGSGREVYAYFNNEGAGNAVSNAMRLRMLLHR